MLTKRILINLFIILIRILDKEAGVNESPIWEFVNLKRTSYRKKLHEFAINDKISYQVMVGELDLIMSEYIKEIRKIKKRGF